jgi:NADPH:quinone reductase
MMRIGLHVEVRKEQQTVRAIVISRYGGPEVLTETELPHPVPGDSKVLIMVKAFGLNHAECYFPP